MKISRALSKVARHGVQVAVSIYFAQSREFQPWRAEIARLLSSSHPRLCSVGDWHLCKLMGDPTTLLQFIVYSIGVGAG